MHYENDVYPRLHPHQRVMLVPGTFGYSMAGASDLDGANGTMLSLDEQDDALVELLKGSFTLEGKTIADIGAGTGLFTKPFVEAVGPSGSVVSVRCSSISKVSAA